jgi:FKBP12-rapamycin complex-associated protein
MKGTDGKEYMFLLKGHEDLRQDERVMQFFSLVNSLLMTDPETFRRNLTIQRYFVLLGKEKSIRNAIDITVLR